MDSLEIAALEGDTEALDRARLELNPRHFPWCIRRHVLHVKTLEWLEKNSEEIYWNHALVNAVTYDNVAAMGWLRDKAARDNNTELLIEFGRVLLQHAVSQESFEVLEWLELNCGQSPSETAVMEWIDSHCRRPVSNGKLVKYCRRKLDAGLWARAFGLKFLVVIAAGYRKKVRLPRELWELVRIEYIF